MRQPTNKLVSEAKPIALVTPRYKPFIGGLERHVEMLAQGLVKSGVAVEVLTLDPSGKQPVLEEIDGLTIRRFPVISLKGVDLAAPVFLSWLLANANRYCLLHVHSYHTPLALQTAMASRQSGVPLLLTPHYHGTGHSFLRKLMHLPYRFVAKWIMHQTARVIAVSKVEQILLQKHFGLATEVAVVPNGIEVDWLVKAVLPNNCKIPGKILVVSRLEDYKQVHHLIAAISFMPKDYKLTIVGDGPARQQLVKFAQQLKVQDRVTFVGQVDEQELVQHYCESQVFVSLSLHEAFGLTLLEAATAGAFVIASDIAAHQEVANYLPTGKVTLLPYNAAPVVIADAIRTAPELARPDSKLLATWALPNWQTSANKVLDCYNEVITRYTKAEI